MKVLIDTCVVVDFLQQRQPFAESALKVFMLAGSGEINGYITAKSVTDIYYLIHHITHSDSVTRETLEKLFSIVEILDTTSNDICLALSSTISDYEDAVMIETGIREKLDCIVTRNLKDYKKAKFTVYSPEEFCSITSQ